MGDPVDGARLRVLLAAAMPLLQVRAEKHYAELADTATTAWCSPFERVTDCMVCALFAAVSALPALLDEREALRKEHADMALLLRAISESCVRVSGALVVGFTDESMAALRTFLAALAWTGEK